MGLPRLLPTALVCILYGCGTPPPAVPSAPAAYHDAVREVDERLPAKGVTALRITSGPGTLEIIGVPGSEELSAAGEICTESTKLAEAKRVRDEIAVAFGTEEPGRPHLHVKEPVTHSPGDRYRVDLVVRVPPEIQVVVHDGNGDLSIRGLRGGVEVVHADGQVLVQDVGGGVTLTTRGAMSRVSEVSGAVQIVDGPGQLHIANVSGSVDVRGGGGMLDVRNVDGNVVARDNAEGMTLMGIDGNLSLYDIQHSAAAIERISGKLEFLRSQPGGK